jgi:ParB/RepB/Spo0J family partition protein
MKTKLLPAARQATLEMVDLQPSAETPVTVQHPDFLVADLPEVPPDSAPTSDFIESIRSVGRIIYPLIIVTTDGKPVIKDGLRRLAAARIIGIKTVPTIELRLTTTRANTLGLILNNNRGANPAAEARMIADLLLAGATEAMIQQVTRMSRQTIRLRLKLLTLQPELQALLRRGKLKVGVADRLAKMPAAEQKKALRQFRKSGALTATDVARVRKTEATAAALELPGAIFGQTEAPAALPAWASDSIRCLRQALALCPPEHPALAHIRAAISSIETQLSGAVAA